MAELSTILGDMFLVLSWLGFLFLSAYLLYQIISYLNQKPPENKTLLDGFYIQMFGIWIFELLIATLLMIIVGLNVKVEELSFIVGNALDFAVHLSAIGLLLSSCCRIIMIYNPSMIEHILDNDILTYSM